MKHLLLILAVTMLLKPLWPLVNYAVNYDYIVTNLCENRDQPMLHCDGKCFLAKQLAQESEEKEKNPFESELSKLKLPMVDWFQSYQSNPLILDSVPSNFKRYVALIPCLLVTETGQPPQTV
ncbi:hypothetical protein D9O36_20630 [Zobellia amurskyensis]|uniref:Uncharacterized protein n=1 Tax=Zobellia amurskyensis TaxID=248905 RepID=A0A7X2ZXK3_9FLAO|nr:hypothetical protein [Zobellia amurskyensis]MUH38262.1 hypothetical protein [Zobellia amurskyensis]